MSYKYHSKMGGYERIQDLFKSSGVKFDLTGARADTIEEARVIIQDLLSVQRRQFENTPLARRPPDPVNLNAKYQVEVFSTLQLCLILCREGIVTKQQVMDSG